MIDKESKKLHTGIAAGSDYRHSGLAFRITHRLFHQHSYQLEADGLSPQQSLRATNGSAAISPFFLVITNPQYCEIASVAPLPRNDPQDIQRDDKFYLYFTSKSIAQNMNGQPSAHAAC
jgi:hypothetical protein